MGNETKRYALVATVLPEAYKFGKIDSTRLHRMVKDSASFVEECKRGNMAVDRKLNDRRPGEHFEKQLYYTDISHTPDGYSVFFSAYRLLTPKSTISDLDEFTMRFEDINGLINYFIGKKMIERRDVLSSSISIIYFENKDRSKKTEKDYDIRTRSIDILFKCDKEKLNQKYIEDIVAKAALDGDLDFFSQVTKRFNEVVPVIEKVVEIVVYINQAKNYQKYNNEVVFWKTMEQLRELTIKMFQMYMMQEDSEKKKSNNGSQEVSISRRRLRDLYFFVKKYQVGRNFEYKQQEEQEPEGMSL